MKTSRSILLALLLASGAALPGAAIGTMVVQAAQGTAIGVDTQGLDTSVKPGDDFEQYANGGWRDKAVIPADRSSLSGFAEVAKVADARNKHIIDMALSDKAAPASDERRIGDWYRAYGDTATIEARGLAPVKPELDAIAAIKDRRALSTALGAEIRADTDPLNTGQMATENLFGLWITQGLATPTVTVPYILQGGLGMPERDYYLSGDAEMVKLRTAYRAYVEQVFKLAGMKDASARADRVMALETHIASIHADNVAAQDAHQARRWKRADFAKKAPGIDWTAFWAAARLPRQQAFIAWEPRAITGLSALVKSQPIAAWQDWLAFHRLNHFAEVLPKAFDEAKFGFFDHTMRGQPQPKVRNERALDSVNKWLGDAMGKIYVRDYFPASSKTEIQAMVKNIQAAFVKRVAALDWMAPATKAEAERKIATMRVGVGYPETWRDYSKLVVRPDDAFGNQRRGELAEYRHQLAKLGRPVDRGEWWMTPQLVNAINLPLQNALNFPAGILQPPFYDPAADPAANYGAIGVVIGHEISHSFDNNGADFDAEGRLRNWWTTADLKHFQDAGAALAAQYDGYEVLPGLHINGKLTLSENIADLAGLGAAYEAYHASLGGKPAPVIGGMTGDQRFFLAFAQVWRGKMRDAALRARVATDGHSPARWRAFTVRNMDGWYDAYGVRPGDKLFLTPEKRVRVW
ncbi:M13 family metallopeptidase [Sphingomonas sp.]|uniref:M13 family metallopeptidase n=1 Tax=Sphingomonas sp. TaxID=28214 RepID=UPI001B2F0A4A|nr:M13 family metallopeptidase [Sphingomonas sp.]MBO9712048.1 M13 family metallopeptidase [Sphingomonas sp.]